MSFSKKIIEWYDENQRTLPWRGIQDPYRIWLSEIILQQTRIEQGREYYERFCLEYPTVQDLAAAEEDQVLKTWQGLGYYSRARNLHSAAKYIVNELDGKFPDTYQGILKLKGVGRYTAAAIASFAFRLPYPVIDGNVYRLISRLYGIFTPIGTDTAYTEFEQLLMRLIDKERPDLFNQAMMDFGSTFCKPTGCDCTNCIFKQECMASRDDKVNLLPVKALHAKIKDRYFYYFDIRWQQDNREMTLVHQRDNQDIWKGLYEFPLLETPETVAADSLKARASEFLTQLAATQPFSFVIGPEYKHQLTHRTIHATFITVFFDKEVSLTSQKEQPISLDKLKNLPVSRLIDKYLRRT
jgi:A/G-specific adenine glycosylase